MLLYLKYPNLQALTVFGYGVYEIRNGYAVADSLDDIDGFYSEAKTLRELDEECSDIVECFKIPGEVVN